MLYCSYQKNKDTTMKIVIGYNNGCGSQDLVALVDGMIVAEYNSYESSWIEAKRNINNSGWYYPPVDYGQNNLFVAKKRTKQEATKLLNEIDLTKEIIKLANGSESFSITEDNVSENPFNEYCWISYFENGGA